MANMYDALQDELKRQREVKALEGSVVLTPEENLENQLSPENLATGMGMGSVSKVGDEAATLLGPKAKAFLAKYGPSRSTVAQKAIQGSEIEGEQLAKDLAPKAESGLGSKYEQFGNPLVDKVNAQESAGFSNNPKLDGSIPNFQLNGIPRTEPAPGSQNFQLKGNPYSGNVPEVMPEAGPHNFNANPGLPSVIENNLPATLPNEIRDVGPIPSKWDKAVDFYKNNKLPIAAGAAGLGAAALNSDTKENKSQSSTQQPEAANFLNSIGMGPPQIPLRNEALPPIPYRNDYKPEKKSIQKPEEQPVDVSSKEEQSTDSSGPDVKVPEAPDMPKTQELAKMMATEDGQEKFADVLHRRDLSVLANQLGQAGNIIGSAIARQEPNAAATKVFQENVAIAQAMPQDFKNKIAAQEEDPDSAVSKNYRDFLTKYGVNVGPGITAKQIKDTLLPAAEKEKLLNEKLQSNKDIKELNQKYLDQRDKDRNALKDQARQDKLDFKDRQEGAQVAKEMNGLSASSRSAVGQAANAKVKSQRLIDLLQNPDVSVQDLSLASADMNSVVSGTATVSGTKHQEYNNLQTDLAKGMSYITSKPQAPDVPEVKQHMIKVATQMQKISDDVQKHHLKIVTAGHKDFFDRRPEIVNGIIGAVENAEMPKDPQIEKWAKQYNVDYDKAAEYIKAKKLAQEQGQ